MALFSKKENTAPKPEEKKKASASKKKDDGVEKKAKKAVKGAGVHLTKAPGRILQNPRITEKAVYMTVQHTYVFDVAQDATKNDVATAVKTLYNVTPRKVNIVRMKPRAYVARFRNRRGTKSGMKKAYVFLKKGDKIDLA